MINSSQAAVLLYCLLDNDAEVSLPLLQSLVKHREGAFDERFAADLLPDILREVSANHAKRSLPVAERERLSALKKIATSVAKWRGRPYTGSGAREEAIRVRLEPYCDLGMFSKPAREKYEYRVTKAARVLVDHSDEVRRQSAVSARGLLRCLRRVARNRSKTSQR